MQDVNYLKKYYSACDTETLIKHILFQTDDFEPEAMDVIKEEYQKRAGNIEELIKSEKVKSGNIEYYISDAQYYNFEKKGYVTGQLFLTTEGIFFVPTHFKKDSPFLFGVFAHTFGPLAIIVDELLLHLPAKKTKEEKSSFPLTLITRHIDYSFGFKTTEIKSMRCWKYGEINIEPFAGKSIGVLCTKDIVNQAQSWGTIHNIHLYQGEGFFNSILEKIGFIFKK